MNWRSVFFLLLLILSCGKTPPIKIVYPIKHSNVIVHSKIPIVERRIIVEAGVDLGPGKIGWNIFEMQDLKVPQPFNPYKTLFKLFPGKYSQADNGTTVSRWTSPKTRKKTFVDWGMQMYDPHFKITFPAEDCQTIYLDTLGFTNSKGEECILYSTSSYEFMGGVLNSGRFAGALLGMALFIKHDNEWVLEKFNPSVGCYGTWTTAGKPQSPRKHEKNEVFYVETCQGGNGGFPSYGVHFIIASVDGTYKEAVVIENSTRRFHDLSRSTTWETEIKYEYNNDDYPMIIAIKTGILDGNDPFLTDDWDIVPNGIKKYAKHHFKFRFREIKYYRFKKDKYELMKTTHEIWDKEWKPVD